MARLDTAERGRGGQPGGRADEAEMGQPEIGSKRSPAQHGIEVSKRSPKAARKARRMSAEDAPLTGAAAAGKRRPGSLAGQRPVASTQSADARGGARLLRLEGLRREAVKSVASTPESPMDARLLVMALEEPEHRITHHAHAKSPALSRWVPVGGPGVSAVHVGSRRGNSDMGDLGCLL
ncbi:hypothetical protein TgHK011_009947 [Trichoderma gracile]|nr:hypothetical protein TgHK011_009947 [Trichoderma gracile]